MLPRRFADSDSLSNFSIVKTMPVPKKVRLLDRQVSAAGQNSAPRQLVSDKHVTNAENGGAIFGPASLKATTVGALPHAIHGLTQHQNSIGYWLGLASLDKLDSGPLTDITVPNIDLR